MDEYTRLKQRVADLEEVTKNLMTAMNDLIKVVSDINNRSTTNGKK